MSCIVLAFFYVSHCCSSERSVTPALFHSRMTITVNRIEFPQPANQLGAALESNLMFILRRVND